MGIPLLLEIFLHKKSQLIMLQVGFLKLKLKDYLIPNLPFMVLDRASL